MIFKSVNLERLLTIADTGSLHAAAEKLAITQPALTRSLRQMEEEVGAQLFLRHARGLTPTKTGLKLLGFARNIARECDLAESQINPRSANFAAHVRIGAGPVWAHSILPQVIAVLSEEFTETTFEIELTTWAAGLEAVREGRLDMLAGGFQGVEDLRDSLAFRYFFDVELCVVARDGHPLFSELGAVRNRLLNFPWVSYQFDRNYIDDIVADIVKEESRRPNIRLYSASLLTTLSTVSSTDMLAILPRRFVQDFTQLGLNAVTPNGPQWHVRSGLVFRTVFRNSEFFNRMCQLVVAQVRRGEGLHRNPSSEPGSSS